MKITLLVMVLFLCGCSTMQNIKTRDRESEYYIKKEFIPLGCSYCLEMKDRISKWEYRIMSLQIQNCYKEEEIHAE